MNESVFLTCPYGSEERSGHTHPSGTEGTQVETFADGLRCLVELRVADESLIGGFWYDTIEVAVADLETK